MSGRRHLALTGKRRAMLLRLVNGEAEALMRQVDGDNVPRSVVEDINTLAGIKRFIEAAGSPSQDGGRPHGV